ncbi:MAG: YveK family protein [Clostridiaceae bacterium]
MDNENGIDLRDFFKIIRKRLVLIVLTTVIATAITALISIFVLTPIYQSDIKIIIGSEDGKEITQSDVTMYQNLMETYKTIASSEQVAEVAVFNLGNDIDTKELIKNTTVTVDSGTMILNIAEKNADPQMAYKGARAMAKAFMESATYLIPTGDVKIMDEAKLSKTPVSPNIKLNILIAGLLGILVSIGLAFILDYMDNTIKTEKDVEIYLGLSVIGNIPKYEAD